MSIRLALVSVIFLAVAVSAQSPGPGRAEGAAPGSPDAQELLQIDQKIADGVVRGDVAFVDGMLASDFSMVHGDQWTIGGKPLLVDDKASFMKRVASQYYRVINFDSVKVEMHGDVAITYGRYVSTTANVSDPGRAWFSVWFERVFAKRNGRWIYLSHRTVNGPTFGPDRQSVSNK